MSSPLSSVPIARRRRAAATLGLFAMLFLAVGAVAATGIGSSSHGGVATVFVVIALVVAVLLALVAWGVIRSVGIDEHQRQIGQAIEDVLAANGTSLQDLTCGCGHDHDPDELHVTDDLCGHDGGGHECSRTCDSCVFSRLERTAEAETVPPRPRPRPRPGP